MDERIKVIEALDLLIEYCLVFVEQVLYHRGIYPKESFTQVQSFQMAVYRNRHPGVRAYLEKFASQLRELFIAGKLNRIFVELYAAPYLLDESEDDKRKVESYGISFRDSSVLKVFRDEDLRDFDRLVLGPEVSWSVVYAEIRASLHSLLTQIATLPGLNGDFPPTFELLVSQSGGNLVLDEKWVLEGRLASGGPTPQSLKSIREADLGVINIKGYIALL